MKKYTIVLATVVLGITLFAQEIQRDAVAIERKERSELEPEKIVPEDSLIFVFHLKHDCFAISKTDYWSMSNA